MSWSGMSREELDKMIPVNPPIVNKNTNPKAHNLWAGVDSVLLVPHSVASQLKTLIPVGTAITIVVAVKYPRVSTSIPTVNIWWAHTINPSRPILNIAYTIPINPNASIFIPLCIKTWEIIPNPGRIRIYTSGCPKNQNKCW